MTALPFKTQDRVAGTGDAPGFAPRARSWLCSQPKGWSLPRPEAEAYRQFFKVVGSWPSDEKAIHNAGMEYAERRVAELLGQGAIRVSTAVRFMRALRRIQLPEYVFPHISADEEGEIIALWIAGKMTLEMSIPAEGDAYLRMTDSGGEERIVGFFPWLPVAEARNFLGHLTRVVTRSNPRWRSLFDS